MANETGRGASKCCEITLGTCTLFKWPFERFPGGFRLVKFITSVAAASVLGSLPEASGVYVVSLWSPCCDPPTSWFVKHCITENSVLCHKWAIILYGLPFTSRSLYMSYIERMGKCKLCSKFERPYVLLDKSACWRCQQRSFLITFTLFSPA